MIKTSTKKILISDPVDQKCAEILRTAGCTVDFIPGIKRDDLKKIISDYNGLIVRSETKVDEELISLMQNMEIIGRAGTGTDNIKIENATRKGIVVMNTPGGNTISAAEHTMALMLSMCRHIPAADRSIKSGKWERKNFQGTELHGKTLGIIGLGKIGREVALRSKAFGMKVLGYDPLLSSDAASKYGIDLIDLNHLFNFSDIISLHIPLNSQTRNLISADTLLKCKPGVKIINCARGGIVNEKDLLTAVENGIVSGAAFDVYEKEPPDLDSALFNNSKIITTPHLGASTEEAQEKVAVQIAEQVIDYFINRKIAGAVNISSETFGEKEELPFIQLAEITGSMLAQVLTGKPEKIIVSAAGPMVTNILSLLKTAVLKGYLSQNSSDVVNYVNAPYLASEIGIITEEIISDENRNYFNLLSVSIKTESVEKKISGTVFGKSELRIVGIDDFRVEFEPKGNLLLYNNIDKPGMLAAVGKILSEENINIAGLSLGRLEKQEKALTIICTDNIVDAKTMIRLNKIEGLSNVSKVKI